MTQSQLPLSGLSVIEIGGGAAGAYCGRLLADAGAAVRVVVPSGSDSTAGIVRNDEATEAAYCAWLRAGKTLVETGNDPHEIANLCSQADLLVLGEDCDLDAALFRPRIATIELSWFGRGDGPFRDWKGNDLVIQALSGMPQMAGRTEGPPTFFGDRQAIVFGGITAYIAACAAMLAPAVGVVRHFEISILEAYMVLSEMHMHFFERDGIPMQRCGLNRFSPNSPVGVYPCKTGWVGITVTTPDQWRSLCKALDLREQAADVGLVTRELRFSRQDEVEAALIRALASRPASEWAALGRQHKVPIVVVPDAAGILDHPIFRFRESLATVRIGEQSLRVPRTPFSLTGTPVRRSLDEPVPSQADASFAAGASDSARGAVKDEAPLAGFTVVDFAMGWAGPLASRLLADLGADVIKIEAARYPDWWRGVNWTPEYIRERGHENAKGFCALNRGKRGVSIDLTTDTGRELALTLIAGADVIVENQASGVMEKLGLGYAQAAAARPDIVMLSMSAFGTGNDWSDTRAYGSTLEQGAGLPSFMGFADSPPTMAHLAFGDPVGGLFGCAAALTALISRRRTGQGQYVNLSMVEAMLQFTTPSLLAHQLDADSPVRRGNRHAAMAPHGIYPAGGNDRWLAVAIDDAASFAALARLIGRPDWADDASLRELPARRAREDEIDLAISAWSRQQDPQQAAAVLQSAGIAAAPIVHAETLFDVEHFERADFFIDLERAFSGPQRQAGLSIVRDGKRLGARRPAPLLGEHTWEVLGSRASVTPERYQQLLRDGVISFEPAPSRNIVAPQAMIGAN